MHYLFVGYYVDEETFNLIVERKINNMSVARQKFEFNLIRGLYAQLGDNIDFVSYVPTNKDLYIPAQSFVGDTVVKHFAIERESIISVVSAGKAFEQYLLELCRNQRNGLKVIMYAVNPVFEHFIIKYKKKYNIKLITICSEVPELRRYGNSMISKVKRKVMTYFNEQFDGYVFFSAEMKNVVRCKNKHSMVLEGIAPEFRKRPETGKKNIIMYAGGLAADNNVPFLLECCKEIAELSEVWICGVGSDEAKIKEIASTDLRIKYFGRLSNDKVLALEEKAKILVNFRSPDEELTKYSFPSKILEYISSGSLVLSTKLRGIPEEYFDYIIPISLDDKVSLKETIIKCLNLEDSVYIEKCLIAQNFIQEKKSYMNQSKRVIDFVIGI